MNEIQDLLVDCNQYEVENNLNFAILRGENDEKFEEKEKGKFECALEQDLVTQKEKVIFTKALIDKEETRAKEELDLQTTLLQD